MHTQIDSHDGMSEQTAAPATATAAVAGGSAGWTREWAEASHQRICQTRDEYRRRGREKQREREMRGKTTGDGEREKANQETRDLLHFASVCV